MFIEVYRNVFEIAAAEVVGEADKGIELILVYLTKY